MYYEFMNLCKHVSHNEMYYAACLYTRRKIVEVILLNFRSNLGHKDKLEVI